MEDPDDDRDAFKDRSKTIKTPVAIVTDADGAPEIPSITKDDGYQTKVVQATLRKYCASHIREFYLYSTQLRLTVMDQGLSPETERPSSHGQR
jgi:hypothetical protein